MSSRLPTAASATCGMNHGAESPAQSCSADQQKKENPGCLKFAACRWCIGCCSFSFSVPLRVCSLRLPLCLTPFFRIDGAVTPSVHMVLPSPTTSPAQTQYQVRGSFSPRPSLKRMGRFYTCCVFRQTLLYYTCLLHGVFFFPFQRHFYLLV